MRAFVTGATGLLGSAIVRRLVREGHSVRGLARSPEKADRVLGDLDVAVVEGDMLDVEGFADELAGCDVLFHTAAYFRDYYRPGDHWDRMRAVNVDGTVDVLRAADRRGVERAVHVSSSGVVGEYPDGRPGDEDAPVNPLVDRNRYFESKLLAERAVDDVREDVDLPVALVLPGWMFGPGDAAPTNSGQLVIDHVTGDLPAVFDGGGCVVDVRDVAAATVAAATRGTDGERYLVAGEFHTLPEVADALESITGVPAPRTLPSPVVAAAARLQELYGRVTGREVSLTVDGIATLRAKTRLDSSKARSELGATFRPLTETLRDEVAWFVEHGYLSPDAVADGAVGVAHEAGDGAARAGDAPTRDA
jgi:dihydroflavonol-4-reductase